MSKHSEYAAECFNSFNCCQSVFTAFCEELGLDRESALKIACAFGGGMSHTDETCGAVTGALMVLGLKHGKFKADDQAAKEKTSQLTQAFISRFKDEFGSVRCTDLLHLNLSKPEEFAKAKESGVFKTICPVLVKRAAEIAEGII